ncbi:IS30 family transposase [Streptomyces sp. NPDC059262]|uniref:IS30 family transposase n=1 Tax=Streptomyces sp. NPDC059262 TaxID=3346797 RepID=UPI00368D0746
MRRPHRQSYERQPRMAKHMVMISERPAEAADRTVPGHWEGTSSSAGPTSPRSAHSSSAPVASSPSSTCPTAAGPAHMRDALIQTVSAFSAQLRCALTWDQGSEIHLHSEFSTATDMPVYFCDPGSPWQRGSNENTKGLLRQYFPKGTDLARYGREELDALAAELNSRPRKTLGWETPAERLTLVGSAAQAPYEERHRQQ